MTTGWKKLSRRDLATFDDFATDAVLTAMAQGGIGKIQTNGHAKIRGKNNVIITIARDSEAPHCRGNVQSALRKAFPALRTNGVTKEESTMTNTKPEAEVQAMLECPSRGCNLKFASADMVASHIDSEHAVCKWEGCDYGPGGGPYVGKNFHAIAGHTNTRHREFKLHLANREKAEINRAATMAAKREAKARQNGLTPVKVQPNGHQSEVEESIRRVGVATVMGEDVAPTGVPHDDEADVKLALIREILGDDPEIAKLHKKIADLKAQLGLVREAAGLDFGDEDSDG